MATEPLPPALQGYAPSKHEKEAYGYLFNHADTQQLGVLTGDLAVPFFSHSGLPPLLLGQVWQIADPDNAGFLSPDRFGVACRLIAHAQAHSRNGAPQVNADWVSLQGPLPRFDGYPIPARIQQQAEQALSASAPPASPAPRATPTRQSSLAPTAPAHAPAGLTSISPADKASYARAFAGANGGSVTGLLDGDKAREIWVKSQLPYDVLGQIWNLADTHSRGALDLTDFTIGMHLLHLVLDGSLPAAQLPAVLDPKLYAAAAGLPAPGTPAAPQSPLRQSSLPTAAAPREPAAGPGAWAVTPAELAESNTWFDSLDAQSGRKGHIDGEQAVGFFGQSGLPVDKLAKVWDLADTQNAGHLTRETFAVAMHLLKRALATPGAPLPGTLPAELVPPSMRAPQQQQSQRQPQMDLLDLLDEDAPPAAAPPAPVPVLHPQSTGASFHRAPQLSPQSTGQPGPARAMSPQATGTRALSPQVTGARALSPQETGASASHTLRGTVFPQPTGSGPASGFESNFSSAPASKTAPTFFDDNDDADLAASASALSARQAGLEREVAELETQHATAGKTRAELEAQVEGCTREVAALQERIGSVRAAHEAERARVDELRARLAEGASVRERAQSDLIRAESDLSALRMEKSEVEGEVLRDKEDVRDLQRRVALVEEEKRILRDELDKARKEARQAKGRGAIARKQLVQGEADRATLERELDTARAGEVDAAAEALAAREAPTAPQAVAAAVPLPATPAGSAALSPAASVRSTNPFDRFVGVSPQHTGAAASKNPFALPAPPAAAAEEGRARETEHEPVHGGTSGLPLAAAAAVGTGALAALGAIGAAGVGLAHAIGVGSADTAPDEAAPAPAPKEAEAERDEPEKDPFGVSMSAAAPAAPAAPDAGAGFGDDFAALPSVGAGDAAAAEFDDEFAALDAPAVPAPLEGTLGAVSPDAGFTDAVRDLNAGQGPDAVAGTLGEMRPDAGFDEAFREVEQAGEGHPAVDKGKARAVDEDEEAEDVFGESASVQPAAAEVDSDRASTTSSSEGEDNGPEEAFGAAGAHTHSPDASSFVSAHADASGFDTPAAGAADLGASTVGEIAAITGEAPPASGGADDTGPTAELASRQAGSREPTTNSESGESFVHVSAADNEPAAAPVAAARRAAPPPPQRASPAPAAVPPEVPAFPPAAAVDNGFADAFGPAAAGEARPAGEHARGFSAEDDFESAFADMSGSSAPAPASSMAYAPATSTGPPADVSTVFAAQPDFDSFDNDFNEFDAENAARTAHDSAQINSSIGGTTAFDEAAFADFDTSFPAPVEQAQSARQADDDAFASFDDSFAAPAAPPVAAVSDRGVPPLGAPLGSTSAGTDAVPQYAPPPGPPPPLKDTAPRQGVQGAARTEDLSGDSDGVRLIRQMGFSKEQALEALEKYDGDVNRAANSLVG